LAELARQWGRIGCIGFGGPPAHIALFHELCVERRAWLTDEQFERAIAATSLLPGSGGRTGGERQSLPEIRLRPTSSTRGSIAT
jgi:chromate transporter